MSAPAAEIDHATLVQRDDFELRIRGLIADNLGVGTEDLARNVSLIDDLAADSLDLVEIALAIETTLGVVLPRYFLDDVRTCGELIDSTLAYVRRRRKVERRDDEPVALRARLTPAGGERGWAVERVLLLTPYAAESLADDALRAGSGARLELSLAPRTSDRTLVRVRDQFSRLGARGIDVAVQRDPVRTRRRENDAA
jgi:acyl carrier protein